MSNIHHYCITGKKYNFLNDLDLKIILHGASIKNLKLYPEKWIKDNEGINISDKNKNFGTLTSHYWLWKNQLKKHSEDDWIGINHYRRFWIKKNNQNEINLHNLSDNILRKITQDEQFDVLLPKKFFFPKKLKYSKLIKKGFRNYIKNPKMLFGQYFYSINLHFDLFHIHGILEESSKFLEEEEREDFINYIKKSNSFYPLEIFISKKKIINKLYEKTFEWIFKCEEEFSHLNLEGYGKERLYDFLAERYFSFYLKKYTKIKTWPFILLEEKFNEL